MSRAAARNLVLGLCVISGIALSWLLLVSRDASRDHESGVGDVVAEPQSAPRAVATAQAPEPAATPLVGAAPAVGEQLDELVSDLDELHDAGRADLDALGLERLRAFVTTVVGAGQRVDAVRALEQRVDACGDPDAGHAWTFARLLVALGGLGAGDAVMDRWGRVPEDQRADVLLGLVWDPLREGDGLVLAVAKLDPLIPQAALLPVTTGRLAPAAARPLLERLAKEAPADAESPRLRDAAIVALGVGIDTLPEPAVALGSFLDQELPTPQSALRPALFVLLSARGDAAQALLARLERRHAAIDARSRWPFGGQPYIDEIVRVQTVACPELSGESPPLLPDTADFAALSADGRLRAAFALLAWAGADGRGAMPSAARRSLGDRIGAGLDGERDVELGNILTHVLLCTGSNWEPSPDDPFLQQLGR